MRKPPLIALVLLAACGDTPPAGFSTGPGVTSVAASTSSSSGEVSSTTTTDDPAGTEDTTISTTSGAVGDLGTMPDFGNSHPPGCKGKVDVLFVISREWTMYTEQDQLLASFKGFVETIETQLADFDYHIMVANPDGYWPGWACEEYLCPKYDPPRAG